MKPKTSYDTGILTRSHGFALQLRPDFAEAKENLKRAQKSAQAGK